jgi:hypothetical protein
MAKKKTQTRQEETGRYFIVNKAGAIHEVTREHAEERLRQVGFRMATKAEITQYLGQGGNQRHDEPICPPWSPEPVAIELDGLQLELDSVSEGNEPSKPTV